MHADDFRLDRYGVVSGLRDGGYSDDMTLAAISGIFLLTFSVQPHSVGIGASWRITSFTKVQYPF